MLRALADGVTAGGISVTKQEIGAAVVPGQHRVTARLAHMVQVALPMVFSTAPFAIVPVIAVLPSAALSVCDALRLAADFAVVVAAASITYIVLVVTLAVHATVLIVTKLIRTAVCV